MTMSVKMLNDIAVHAEGLASEAVAMAEALRAVVDDCAAQVAANRSPDNPTGKTDPEWLEDAQKNIVPPEAEPGKKLTIAEVRAYVAERTRPENRAQILQYAADACQQQLVLRSGEYPWLRSRHRGYRQSAPAGRERV